MYPCIHIRYRRLFTSATKGDGILNAVFDSYAPYAGPINQLRKNGVLVSTEGGNSTNYALDNLGTRHITYI